MMDEQSTNRERVDPHAAIWEYQKAIVNVYEDQNLTSLEGLGMEFKVNGIENAVAWFFQIVRKGQNKYENFDFHHCFDDLIFCSNSILYYTANLYLYRPYLNNPIREGFPFAGKILFPNHLNIEGKRFNMHTDTLFEKVYNYWDRIGDLIGIYFQDIVDPRRAYFTTVIDKIPAEFHNSENYQWLLNFRINEFREMNDRRKRIVHYISTATDFRYKHADNSTNREGMDKLLEERDQLPDYFKNHIKLTMDGFERGLLLIEEITEKYLSDIE